MPVDVKGIESKHVPVKQATAGQMCGVHLALGASARKWLEERGGKIRKGMVLVAATAHPEATWSFEAEV